MEFTNEQVAVMADTYKLLGDYTRLKIMLTCLDEKTSVNDIAEKVGVSQSLVSHHIRLLKAARLVAGERKNKQVFYEAADGHIIHMLNDMIEHIQEEV